MTTEAATLDDKPTTLSSIVEDDVKSTNEVSAETSTAKDEKTIADAVKETADAAKDATESSTEATQETTTEAEPDAVTEDQQKAESVEEEVKEETQTKPVKKVDDAKLPFNNHPRWKEVLAERDTAKQEVEKLKPLADSAQVLANYCQTNGITEDDLREALDMARLARADVKAFRDRLQVYADSLDVTAGTRLPADLQKKVDDGLVDAETAKELAQARLAAGQAKTSSAKTEQQLAQQRQQMIVNSLNTWEQSKKKADPDYEKQFDMISDRFAVLRQQNPPQTPAEAVSLAEQAYSDVKKRLHSYLPKPAPRKVLTAKSASTKNGEELRVDSMEDIGKIVRYAASRRR